MSCLVPMIGRKFGYLTVVERVENDAWGRARYKCLCRCGRVTTVSGYSLRDGSTKSCECKRSSQGGVWNTRLYRIYIAMIKRCCDPGSNRYKNYGGKGIRVCLEWKKSFFVFRLWAEQSGYADNLTIDRIDVRKGYSPTNCRWATYTEQANNKTTNRWLVINGKRKTMAMWAKEGGAARYKTIWYRLNKGWSAQEAVFGKGD